MYAEEQTITEWQSPKIASNEETQINIVEVRVAIKGLKNRKAPIKNDVQNELIIYGGPKQTTITLNTETNTTQETRRLGNNLINPLVKKVRETQHTAII